MVYPEKITIHSKNDIYEYPTDILMPDGVTETIDWMDKRSRKAVLNQVVSSTRFIDER